ncbi:MAG: hypothetical protein HY049_04605 [Acidobacteria bacterium]|nr:hypothetical protein [Acidobacteriota bacterium]
MWTPRAAAIVAILTTSGALLPGIALAKTKIPSERLTKATYTSPDGAYTLARPAALVEPGSQVEERQISPSEHGVFFTDDFGVVFYLIRTDNSKENKSLDQLSAGIEVGDLVREKRQATIEARDEIRVVHVNKGGSPVVTRTKEKGERVDKRNDLIEALAIFRHGSDIYTLTAGVTALNGQPESEMVERAKGNLEAFLKGLQFKDKETVR